MANEELILGGRYRVVGPMDCGTLADIRLAYDTLLRRKVTIKLAMEDESATGRGWYPVGVFKREAELAASLQHPHLLAIHDYGIDGTRQYLVMRYFNETLREHIRRFTPPALMPLDMAVPLFQSIAGAVDYLHAHGPIVHGNLKPNNIVLDTEFETRVHPFVSDFGVATTGAGLHGTPIYMAPEQAAGGGVSYKADLFALGIILFESLTGSLPFLRGDIHSILLSKIKPVDGQYSVRRFRADLPAGVDLVVEGLTRPEPSERYASASAAIDEIARAFYSGQSAIEGTVFLSYAREESEYVHALARRLRSVGIKVWIDQDIQPGTNWDRSVEEGLQLANSMLLVISRAAMQSETVRDEWSYFLDQGKAVYPVIYEPCELPLRLRRRQHIAISRDLLSDVARVVAALAEGSRSAKNVVA